jgi:ADP-glucose pyrophosphorylase
MGSDQKADGKVSHHDVEIVLKAYELRRDPLMRESRDKMNRQFQPQSLEDLQAVLIPNHPFNASYRQVSTYWEMVYSFARYGAINPDFLAESNSEGLLLFAKVFPFLPQLRETAPTAFRNAEWLVANSPLAAERFEIMKKRVQGTKS